MDPEISLMFTSSLPNGIPRSKIRVILDETYNRRTLPSHEGNIEKTWKRRKEQNTKLFDNSKFRLHSLRLNSSTDEVTFCLGLTSYKDYLGTNWSDSATELLELGKSNFGNSQEYMSDPLGVGALMTTADDYAVFLNRSEHVGEAPGLWDIPGGHPEPGEVKGGAANPQDNVISNLTASDVGDELFNSVIHEIRDEVNVPVMELGEPLLMGVTWNHCSSGRRCANFVVRCSLHSRKVKELYHVGGPEAEESTIIQFVPLKELYHLEHTDMWKKMSPSGKGCVKLYTTMTGK